MMNDLYAKEQLANLLDKMSEKEVRLVLEFIHRTFPDSDKAKEAHMITHGQITSIIKLAADYPYKTRAGIFGSYARGEQTSESDVDILYDYDTHNDAFVYDVLGYSESLTEEFNKLGMEFDYVSYQGVLESHNSEMRESILNDVVWIYTKS